MMRSNPGCRVVFLACLAVLFIANSLRATITLTAATDQSDYRRGEAIDFSITAHNSDAVPVGLAFPSSLQSMYFIDSSYFYPQIGATVITARTIPANGSYTWTYRHQWTDYDIPLGSHSFHGWLDGYMGRPPMQTPTGSFTVIPNGPPPAALNIDFDHPPDDSAAALASATEYWPSGVRFRTRHSDGDRTAGIRRYDGNQFLTVDFTSYPPGFNLAADFDGLYTQASADVAAAVGVTVTMIAKSADGDVLATTTSPPMTALYDFVPLSIAASEPIKTLEWWPSNPQSGLHVDNLIAHTPEPAGGVVLLGLAVVAVVRSTRGAARRPSFVAPPDPR